MNIVQWVSTLAVKASLIPNLFGGKKKLGAVSTRVQMG